LSAIAWSAAAFLTSPAAATVGACPGVGCGWVFADPRGRRRWCSMAWCGNRAKARPHAQRLRDTVGADAPSTPASGGTWGPTATPRRPRGRFSSCLMTGLFVHLVDAVIFAITYATRVNACHESETTMAALATAAGSDALLTAAVLLLTRK